MAAMMKNSRQKRKATARKTSGFGQAILASLRGWERGERMTLREVKSIRQPRALSPQDIRRLRTVTLGVSQTVFARLLGVSPKLVEAWESGRNSPAGPVRRLFELIERDPKEFLMRYTKGAA